MILDDKDEFASEPWGSLREFLFEPMDSKLRIKIKAKLKREGFDVKAVKFRDNNIEVEILGAESGKMITNYYYWGNDGLVW